MKRYNYGMTLPNFILIGPAIAGTTSLYAYLSQHPDIYSSPIKEPGFFILNPGFPRPVRNSNSLNYTFDTFPKYQSLFEASSGKKAVGEGSTAYFPDLQAPARIKETIPDLKLITILRDPAARAFSEYVMCRGHLGIEPCDTFQAALEEELDHERILIPGWRNHSYLEAGFYFKHLKNYLSSFERRQLLILFFQDLKNNPQHVLNQIYEYLNVDPNFESDTEQVYNRSGIPKSKLLHILTHYNKGIIGKLKNVAPDPFRKKARDIFNTLNYVKPNLLPETRSKLIDIYYEDILQLQELTGRSLEKWLQ